MTDEVERAPEHLFVVSAEELRRVFREVLDERGIAPPRWDRSYKGDAFWVEYRAHVVQLVTRNVAISYHDLDQDQWFAKVAGVREWTQWRRAVDQHLIPNRPPGSEGREFVAFTLVSTVRQTRYLTFKAWLHCAIEKVGRRRRDAIRDTRAKYGASEPCGFCRAPRAEG